MAPHRAQRQERARAAAELERNHPPRLVDHRQAKHAEGSERRREHEEHDLGPAQLGVESSIVLHGWIVPRGQDDARGPGGSASPWRGSLPRP